MDNCLSNEQRGELINRSLYKILNEIELRINTLPTHLGKHIYEKKNKIFN